MPRFNARSETNR